MKFIDKKFFTRDTVEVAKDLIGKAIIVGDKVGIISETEAYCGETDLACHARFGRTKRSQMLYRKSGTIYVYLCYGMHWMLNFVTEDDDKPGAVLVRGIVLPLCLSLPQRGPFRVETTKQSQNKGIPTSPFSSIDKKDRSPQDDIKIEYISGPGKVTKYFGIDGTDNGKIVGDRIKLIEGINISSKLIKKSPRVGIGFAPEPWCSKKWRFYINK